MKVTLITNSGHEDGGTAAAGGAVRWDGIVIASCGISCDAHNGTSTSKRSEKVVSFLLFHLFYGEKGGKPGWSGRWRKKKSCRGEQMRSHHITQQSYSLVIPPFSRQQMMLILSATSSQPYIYFLKISALLLLLPRIHSSI